MFNNVTTFTKVGSSPCSGGVRRHRSSSHRQSIFHFPFVLSCFPTDLVLISLIKCCVFNPLFSPCLCVELFVFSACAHLLLVHIGFCTHDGYCIKLLRLLPSSALLCLTSLPPVTHTFTNNSCLKTGV